MSLRTNICLIYKYSTTRSLLKLRSSGTLRSRRLRSPGRRFAVSRSLGLHQWNGAMTFSSEMRLLVKLLQGEKQYFDRLCPKMVFNWSLNEAAYETSSEMEMLRPCGSRKMVTHSHSPNNLTNASPPPLGQLWPLLYRSMVWLDALEVTFVPSAKIKNIFSPRGQIMRAPLQVGDIYAQQLTPPKWSFRFPPYERFWILTDSGFKP